MYQNHIDSNPYYLTIPSSGLVEGYPGVGESTEGGSNQFLYQHARNFDWGMTSAVGIEIGGGQLSFNMKYHLEKNLK